MMDWGELYEMARGLLNPRDVSPFVSAGGVGAVIQTGAGHIFKGVCIDTACSLGLCAERSAIAAMLTAGESRVTRLVCVMKDGRVGSPCGACRELLMQLGPSSAQIEILTAYPEVATVRLGDLMPDWWGKAKFGGNDD